MFEDVWPLAADHLEATWREHGPVTHIRLEENRDITLGEVIDEPTDVTMLASLGVPVTETCLDRLPNLAAAFALTDNMYGMDEEVISWFEDRGIEVIAHESEGFWGQSVAEFALALTINGLRKIPQKHKEMTESHDPWDREDLEGMIPGSGGHQFGDDPRYVNGTVAGKRVRVVGVGNIGSRYASFCDFLGADVAAFDPFADEPCFHRSGARQVYDIETLPEDADIFAPMVPLMDSTEGLVTRAHIEAVPEGSLLVLATRAGICDTEAVKERVLADEISLAADVFDTGLAGEPVPLDDPLLDRHNVVHTPHIAGRTRDANEQWAEDLVALFEGGH